MDTAIMEDMATIDIMERERLKPPLLLSQDIIIMAMDMVMDMVDMVIMDTMEREKLRLATIMVMDLDMDMVDMVTMAIMERDLQMLRPLLMLMLIHSSLDVAIIITMAIGIIMAMAMDTMDNEKRQTEQFMYSNTKSSVIYFSHGVGFVMNLVMTRIQK